MSNANTALEVTGAPTKVNPLASTQKTAEQAAADAEVDNFLTAFEAGELEDGGVEEPVADGTATTETEVVDDATAADAEVVDDDDDGEVVDDDDDEDEEPVVKKKPTADAAGMARLDAREKELREKEAAYETRVADAVKAKIPDFTGKDPEDILKHYGNDPDIAFKRMLLKRLPEKMPDGSPNKTREKLAGELKDANTQNEINQLRAEMKRKDESIEQQKFVAKFTSDTREQVGKLDSKSLPVLSEMTKAKDGGDFVHRLIMKEIIDEAQVNQIRGEQKPLMTFDEATKRVEAFIAKVKTMMTPANTAATVKKPSMTSPKLKVTLAKPSVADDLNKIIDQGILAGENEYRRVKKSGKVKVK